VFDASYYGEVIHEIRKMQVAHMGQYAHGNQPARHVICLYNYAAQSWKAQYWVREVLNRLYRPTPDGYCGDEDNGQTSAWYVFFGSGLLPRVPRHRPVRARRAALPPGYPAPARRPRRGAARACQLSRK